MSTPDVARALSERSVSLFLQGRPVDALISEQEVVTIYRRLAETHPGRYREELAGSLRSLGTYCSASGHTDEAIRVTQEAVAIYRTLDAPSGLALSLSNLGHYLASSGRPAEAVTAVREAAAIYRSLAETHPGRYRDDLAGSLHRLGAYLLESSLPAEALTAT